MKKVLFLWALLLLAGCNPNYENQKEENKALNTGNSVITWNKTEEITKQSSSQESKNVQKNEKSSMGEQKVLQSNNQKMDVAKKNDRVLVDYIGFFPDGKVFDTSIKEIAQKEWIYNAVRDYKPLEFVIGAWQMIPCFDKAVEWMKVWETKEITCQPKDAYGECDENKIKSFPKSQFKQFEEAGYKIEKWAELPTQYWMVKVVDVDNDNVKIDFNNPMCGKILKFKITLREIKK